MLLKIHIITIALIFLSKATLPEEKSFQSYPSFISFSKNQNYSTEYIFQVYISTSIPSKASISIEFPVGFHLPSTCKAYIKPLEGSYSFYECRTQDLQLIIIMEKLVSGIYHIMIENISNPDQEETQSFKIRTYKDKEILVDEFEEFRSDKFLPVTSKKILRFFFNIILELTQNLKVKENGDFKVNKEKRFQLEFLLLNELIKDDSIKINLPEGFKFIHSKILYQGHGCCTKIQILPNERMLLCEGFRYDIKANNWEIISVTGILAPTNPGEYSGFYLEHIEEKTSNVFEKVSLSNPIVINLEGKPNSKENEYRFSSFMNYSNYSLVFLFIFI